MTTPRTLGTTSGGTANQPTLTIRLPRRPDRRPGPMWLRRTDEAFDVRPYERFGVEPLSPTIGAVITGLDLRELLPSEVFKDLHRALLEWKVIFFRDQQVTAAQHIAFAKQWGEIEVHPFITAGSADTIQRFERGEASASYENEWHTDNTWRECPSLGAVLRAIEVPPVGGDTLFADMAAAYDNLDDDLRDRIEGARAEHDWERAFGMSMPADRIAALRLQFSAVEHPVVRTHPETGRKTLFVNSNFTTRLLGFDPQESRELLDLLYRQADRPEYQCRFRWRPDSIAVWDNRAVQHYAASDYWPERRVMERIAIVGDKPY